MGLKVKNVLLDRDGTIIFDKHYLCDEEQVELLPGAGETLAEMAGCGIRLFVITNQSGIGRGYFGESEYAACRERLDCELKKYGAVIEKTLHCPHAPDEKCSCRKPLTGLWEKLHRDYGLRPEETVMIGDKRADVDFGRNAGLMASVLVLTGKGEKEAHVLGIDPPDAPWVSLERKSPGWPDILAVDISAAWGALRELMRCTKLPSKR